MEEGGAVRSEILVALALAGAAAAGAQEPVAEPLRPVEEREAGGPVLPVGAAPAAQELAFDASCSDTQPGRGLVRLAWLPHAPGGGAQRVDVTAFRDGFSRERFEATRSLPKTVDGVVLDGLVPGLNYYWRVLRRTEAGWAPSGTARFEAPICPVDSMLDGPEPGR